MRKFLAPLLFLLLSTPAYALRHVACQEKCSPSSFQLHKGHENKVQTKPELYLIFWGPWWGTHQGQTTKEAITRDVGALHGSSYADILTQYYDFQEGHKQYISNDWRLKGSWFSASSSKDKDIDFQGNGESVLRTSAKTVIAEEFLSHHITPTSNTSVMVFPETGAHAAHETAPEGQCQGAHQMTEYEPGKYVSVAVSWPGQSNRFRACAIASYTKSVTHEWAEMITDPENRTWMDKDKQEVADECSAEYGQIIILHNNLERLQMTVNPLWSNRKQSCLLGASPDLNWLRQEEQTYLPPNKKMNPLT